MLKRSEFNILENVMRVYTHPPIHLLHSIDRNTACVTIMKKREPFPINEVEFKFNKIVNFSLSEESG